MLVGVCMEEQRYKLKKLVAELSKLRGRHTELVTVYVTAGANLIDTVNQLRNEQGTAENIKSKGTRKNVVSALEKILQHLKLYPKTPVNGLAVFCGNVSEHEGADDIRLWAVEPPDKLEVKRYWCDQKFITEPIEDMVKEKEVFGLLVMDTKEATIGVLRGKKIHVLRNMDSIVPGKTAQGGQSSSRYARIREGLVNDFYKMIAENMKALMPPEAKGIIIGGPGPSKKEFNDNEYLPTDLQKKILVVKDIGYTDEYGLEELVQRSQDVLSEAAIAHEKALLEKFFVELQKGSGLVVYKPEDIQKALESGAVDMLIVSENARVTRCPSGHFTRDQKCHLCQMKTEEVDATDAFKDIAHQYGTKVEIISRDTREGQQLFNIGGLGATLRWG